MVSTSPHLDQDLRHRPHANSVPGLSYPEREELFDALAPLVKRLLRQYGANPELRQDLVGEIYCRFCALLDAYDPKRGVPLRPYLIRQLTAAVYSYTRKQRNVMKHEIPQSRFEGNSLCEYQIQEPSYDPTASWLVTLSQQEILCSLPQAIAQLPPRQRQIVYWRYYEDLSFDVIAGLLAITPATARSLLRHGLNNLRKQMQQNHQDACFR